jgi:acyl-coenzyme A thioesterase PaaI-like protein
LDTPAFDSSPDPDNPGWLNWQMTDASRYNGTVLGKMLVRSEGDNKARLRMYPEHRHSNLRNALHGGVTLGFIDVAMFCASRLFGLIEAGAAAAQRAEAVEAAREAARGRQLVRGAKVAVGRSPAIWRLARGRGLRRRDAPQARWAARAPAQEGAQEG